MAEAAMVKQKSVPGSNKTMEISFHNRTRSKQSIILMAFARYYPSPMTMEILKMAWKLEMVSPMQTIQFKYPVSNQICAFYKDKDNRRVTGNMMDAEPGSAWIVSTAATGEIILERDVTALRVPSGGYVVNNRGSIDGDGMGRVIDITLHKGGDRRPFVSKQCRVGNYVTLTNTSCLYFGAMIPSYSLAHEFKYNYKESRRFSYDYIEFSDDSFTLIPEAEFTDLVRVNLLKYAEEGKLDITLTEEVTSNKLLFKVSTAGSIQSKN